MQTTIAKTVTFHGRGLHRGLPVELQVHPAPANHGIVFRRSDLGGARLPAMWSHVNDTRLNTRLSGDGSSEVSTIEHLMAAFAGLGVHNALCVLNGPEVPILDGSSAPFVAKLIRAGLRRLDEPLRVIEVLRPVRAKTEAGQAVLEPCDHVRISFQIDFDAAAIGKQRLSLNMANGAFLRELCDSRTFCKHADVERMQATGLALGGTLDNAVVVDGARVLSPGGLRHRDEPVRHKMLDALGDLYCAGAPILGHYTGIRAGHGLTNALLRALFADSGAWRWRLADAALLDKLPGSHVTAEDLRLVA